MTWNVENLFLAGSPSGPKNQENYAQRLMSLTKVMLALDPDVLALHTAESVALRVEANILLEGNHQQGLIVLGDLNGVPSAAITQAEIIGNLRGAANPSAMILYSQGITGISRNCTR